MRKLNKMFNLLHNETLDIINIFHFLTPEKPSDEFVQSLDRLKK